MTENRYNWIKKCTPKKSKENNQNELDWWHNLPIQDLVDMADSKVGYLWKFYPEKDHPYHLTESEIKHIYNNRKK